MSDRRNRAILLVIGLVLLALGVLSACLGAGVFGTARSNRDVFDPTLVRWWNEGGWKSFAVVVAIGVVAVVIGLWMALSQLRRNQGRHRTPLITFPLRATGHGETTLRASALSHTLEADLARIPDVRTAMVGLFGSFPEIELRAVLDVGDYADLDRLPGRVEDVLGRMETSTGVRPDPVQITLRFRQLDRQREIL